MSDWNRSTQEIFLSAIRPEMKAAIEQHLESYNLGRILDDAVICVETTSEKKKKGLFGKGGQTIVECAILTPTWLVLVVKGNDPGAAVLSAQLKDMTFNNYADSPGYKLIPDTGIEVSGVFTGRVGMHGNQRIGKFVGLGVEPAAGKFLALLAQAVQATRR
jgi:hypothetical protein